MSGWKANKISTVELPDCGVRRIFELTHQNTPHIQSAGEFPCKIRLPQGTWASYFLAARNFFEFAFTALDGVFWKRIAWWRLLGLDGQFVA